MNTTIELPQILNIVLCIYNTTTTTTMLLLLLIIIITNNNNNDIIINTLPLNYKYLQI